MEHPRKRSARRDKPDNQVKNGSARNPFKEWEHLVTLGAVLIGLTLFEVLSRLGIISAIIFPPPTLIIKTLFEGIFMGLYSTDLYFTFTRLFFGFLIGGGVGLVLGLIMGWSRPIRKILDPIIAALHPLPKNSLLPIIIILLGIGESSRIAMVSIAAFFPMLLTTITGVLQINPIYYEVVKNYGGNTFDEFKKVVFPGSLPSIMSGARLAFQSALTITIMVEMIFSNTGLGSILWLAWETMRLAHMYSVLIIIALIGILSTWLIKLIKNKLTPWHQEIRPS